MLASFKIGLPSPFSLAKNKIYYSTHLRTTRVFPIPTGRVERVWFTNDTHFYLMQITKKQKKPGLYLLQAEIIFALNPQLFI